MNSDFTKLKQRSTEKEELRQLASQESGTEHGRQFNTVEDLLRHDAEQNPAPPEIAERLNDSIATEPKPKQSWFSRFLSGG
jgi:negative regulator of sigma E activity